MSDNPSFPGSPSGPLGPLGSPPGLGPDGFPRVPQAGQPLPMDGAGGKATKRGKAKKAKPDKAATKRVVSTNRMLAIGAALVAVVAFLMATPATTYVVVTTQPVPALSPVTSSELTAVKATATNTATGAYTGKSVAGAIAAALAGSRNKITAIPLVTGQQVFSSAFSTNSAYASSLGPNDRLISVDAPVSGAVGGTLAVGDNVDVLSSSTGVVAPGAVVVSILASQSQYDNAQSAQSSSRSQTPSQLLPTAPVPGIYVLRTSSENAAAIAQASGTTGGGTLSLAFRAPVGASSTGSTTPGR